MKPGTGSAAAYAILRTLLVLLVAACSRPVGGARVEVAIRNFAFEPESVRASAGDTVVFRNHDVVPHTATAAGAFDSDSMGASAEWRWVVPDSGGRYEYICVYHPTMKGVLVAGRPAR